MPWCPKCKAEYREGFTECEECKVPLIDKKPEEEGVILSDIMEQPTKIYTASTRLEAEAIEDMLRENGIAVIDRPASFGQVQAYSGADSRFGVELLVDEKLADQTKELIAERKENLKAPIDINELARLAEEQSLQSQEQDIEDNASFKLLPLILGFIVLMIILLFITVKM